jgi:hypothetical protein
MDQDDRRACAHIQIGDPLAVHKDGVNGHTLNGVELRRDRRGRRASGHDVTQKGEGEQRNVRMSACVTVGKKVFRTIPAG